MRQLTAPASRVFEATHYLMTPYDCQVAYFDKHEQWVRADLDFQGLTPAAGSRTGDSINDGLGAADEVLGEA